MLGLVDHGGSKSSDNGAASDSGASRGRWEGDVPTGCAQPEAVSSGCGGEQSEAPPTLTSWRGPCGSTPADAYWSKQKVWFSGDRSLEVRRSGDGPRCDQADRRPGQGGCRRSSAGADQWKDGGRLAPPGWRCASVTNLAVLTPHRRRSARPDAPNWLLLLAAAHGPTANQQRLALVVDDHIEERRMHFECVAVLDEAELAKFVHEEIDARPRRANPRR
jgi:hypothetical protein